MYNTRVTLRMAVVGVGYLGRQHARILGGIPGVSLEAVVDILPERARDVAQAAGAREHTTDYRDVLGHVDAVTIATPTTVHYEIARAFVERKIPVLVEKPLAKTVEEAEDLVLAAEARRLPLAVGHVERFNPVLVAVREKIRRPRFVESHRLSAFPRRSADIDVILDLMIHDLDILLHLVESPVRRVDAVGVSMLFPNEDIAHARLEFEDGCVANLTASRISRSPMRRMRVFSEELYATMDFLERTTEILRPTPELQRARREMAQVRVPTSEDLARLPEKFYLEEVAQFPNGEPLASELSAFVECLRNGREPVVSGVHGLRAMRASAAIMQKVREHRWSGS